MTHDFLCLSPSDTIEIHERTVVAVPFSWSLSHTPLRIPNALNAWKLSRDKYARGVDNCRTIATGMQAESKRKGSNRELYRVETSLERDDGERRLGVPTARNGTIPQSGICCMAIADATLDFQTRGFGRRDSTYNNGIYSPVYVGLVTETIREDNEFYDRGSLFRFSVCFSRLFPAKSILILINVR